jgi:hypothetical protein
MTVRYTIVQCDGQPMAVIRPSDPKLALALAETALKEQNSDLLADLPSIVEESGAEYTLVGYAAHRLGSLKEPKACIVDEKKNYVGELQPGDSFVTLREADA